VFEFVTDRLGAQASPAVALRRIVRRARRPPSACGFAIVERMILLLEKSPTGAAPPLTM
jgi:hypothetical protein